MEKLLGIYFRFNILILKNVHGVVIQCVEKNIQIILIYQSGECDMVSVIPSELHHKSLPITPELRDIPLTHLDCEQFLGKTFVQQSCGTLFVAGAQTDEEMSCETARRMGYCPRGFAP